MCIYYLDNNKKLKGFLTRISEEGPSPEAVQSHSNAVLTLFV